MEAGMMDHRDNIFMAEIHHMNQSMPTLYNGCGAARFLGKPESWGRFAFNRGLLPVEATINGHFPAVTEQTLKRLAPRLRRLPTKYPIN